MIDAANAVCESAELAINSALDIFYITRSNSWNVLVKLRDSLVMSVLSYGIAV